MKLNLLSKISGSARALFLATLAILATGALKTQASSPSPGTNFFNNTIAGYSLGTAGGDWVPASPHQNWAIFALSGGVTITDSALNLTPGNQDVWGNIGIAGGNLSMTASWVQGSVYRQFGTQTVTPGANITGTSYSANVVTDSAIGTAAAVTTASANWGALGNVNALSYSGPISGGSPSYTLTGAADIFGAAATTYVANLNDVILSGVAAVLTLHGTNTTNYIFNVSRFLTLGNQAKIVLADGLTAANVLFNVKNTSPAAQYDVGLSGGSELNGIILAPSRNVKLTGASKINGEVIAKGVSLSGASKVWNPFVSP